MVTPEESAKFDQSSAFIADSFPETWWRMFSNLKNKGFSEEQALDILKTYITAICSSARAR